MGRGILAAVAEVQASVAVPKARYNSFGKFSYRSYEDIVAALKDPCRAAGIAFRLEDRIERIGDRYYVAATATAFFADGSEGEASSTAYAREDEHKKGSDDAQVTGMASSYARKYALCGLFAIDGQSDPDSMEPAPSQPPADGPFTARCRSCGTRYQFEGRDQYEAWLPTAACCPSPAWEVE